MMKKSCDDWFGLGVHEVGLQADEIRRRKHGNKAYYVVNAHINPTNICSKGCPLCAFAAAEGDAKGYVLELDEILQRGERAERVLAARAMAQAAFAKRNSP